MLKSLLFVYLFITLLLPLQLSAAETGASSLNLDSGGIALEGYDPVSYHRQGPEKGKNALALDYNGATYLFSNSDNLETFKASPDQYLPAYGGWCAWAMLDLGEKVEVDPKTYKIIDGTSYLFYNAFFVNTLTKWNNRAKGETEKALVIKAQSEWELLESAL